MAVYADDSKCYRVVRRQEKCEALQNDLFCLFNWTALWGLSFNVDKCEVLRISRNVLAHYHLLLRPVPTSWGPRVAGRGFPEGPWGHCYSHTQSLHISIIVAKANRKLGYLRPHCSADIGTGHKKRLYLAFVRSNLEYESEVWAPESSITDRMLLERV